MILITSSGEFSFYHFTVSFFFSSFHFLKKKKKRVVAGLFFCVILGCPISTKRIACSSGLNCDQMEEGEQYSEYSVERNPRAYMSMRNYRNLP